MLYVMERVVPLMPLHQAHNLAPVRLLLERLPALPQVACFDTSFRRNNARGGTCISAPGSALRLWVIPTNKEVMIARHTRRLVA